MASASFGEKIKALLSAADTIISVRPGLRPYPIKGRVAGQLLQEIEEVVKERTGAAYIYQYGNSREYHLTFSKSIPKSLQQRLRNVWGIHSR